MLLLFFCLGYWARQDDAGCNYVYLKIYSFVSFSGSLVPHTFHDSTEFFRIFVNKIQDHPSIHPSIHPSVRPSVRPSLRPSVRPSTSVRATLGSIWWWYLTVTRNDMRSQPENHQRMLLFWRTKTRWFGARFLASGFLSANGLMVNDGGFGAFGGLNSSDPPNEKDS